jgi:hypothetical protein
VRVIVALQLVLLVARCAYEGVMRRVRRSMPAAAPTIAAKASEIPLVVTQVRQALQQTAAIGAFSLYFPAA